MDEALEHVLWKIHDRLDEIAQASGRLANEAEACNADSDVSISRRLHQLVQSAERLANAADKADEGHTYGS